MITRRQWLKTLLATGTVTTLSLPGWAVTREDSVKVALLESIFTGQEREKVIEQIKPFAEIIKKDTGTDAVFDVMNYAEMEKEFKAGKVQLVILSGLEFAWMQAVTPDAKPLLVASIDPGATKTVIVTKQGDVAKDLKDLAGASLAIPDKIPFISQQVLKTALGQSAEKAFKLVKSGNVDDTLEEVLDGKARGAIVTGAGMEVFRERKPGRFKKLKVVFESPDLPPTTVMYNDKVTDKAALARFKDALIKSNEKPEGNRVLTLYKLKGFEPFPEGFEKKAAEMGKAYPQ
ncbi:MAG: PhnD/SsuA/transferrin family substrate-binding protein [Gemmatales bacterium]